MVSRRTRVAVPGKLDFKIKTRHFGENITQVAVVAQEIRYSSSGIPQEHGDCEGIIIYQPGGETSPASCV